ncbi:MAG: tRNA 2-thiouridine(34) synthase MnmA [Dehalococcoidia bacterium]|nr:MAG: tRNA 2-thiouridine(34) synthase MnmA [Dehalococcoidia bacterium]
MPEKILVALSGGVDSAVAAAILKKAGHQLTAVTMKICVHEEPSGSPQARHGCYGLGESEDIEDARRVAAYLEIPFHVLDLCREYENEVLSEFISGYEHGRTPNPCVYCNPRIKFGALVEAAEKAELEFQRMATGHYARTEYDTTSHRYLLKRGADPKKDQSYFLAFLNQRQLSRAVFPLGGYTKPQVRQIASEMALPVSDKPESQDFVSGGYQSLLPDSPPGPVIDKSGRKLGTHSGISRYTIGQHKGLDLPGREKLYVVKILPQENTLVVGGEEDLLHKELTATGLNWIAVEGLSGAARVEAKIRSGAQAAPALLEPLGVDVRVVFDAPQKGITPGQAAVFYQGDVVLGAGIICEVPD